MSLTRRSVLASAGAGALAAGLGGSTLARGAPGTPKLIVILANGGWDTTYCFDPKLGVAGVEGPEVDADPANPEDVDAVETWSGIPIVGNPASRPSVSQFFERWGSRTAVVNGVAMGSIAHQACRLRVLTGTGRSISPDVTSIAGRVLGSDLPLGSIDFSGLGYVGSLGAWSATAGANGQLRALVDPTSLFVPGPGAPPTTMPDDAARAAVAGVVGARHQAFRDRFGAQVEMDAWDAARLRADRLLKDGPAHLGALPIGLPPEFNAQSAVGVDLLASGLCRAILLDSGEAWDTHYDTADQQRAYERFFRSLGVLIDGLDTSGQLDDTLVAVVSEMGRMPVRNEALGKDHWSHTSAMFLGGPVRGGRVLGATDDGLTGQPVDLETGEPDEDGTLVQYSNLVAGLLDAIGVDPEEWLPGTVPYRGPYA